MRVRENVDLPRASGMNDVAETAAQANERAGVLNGIEALQYRNRERERPGYRILVPVHDGGDDISLRHMALGGALPERPRHGHDALGVRAHQHSPAPRDLACPRRVGLRRHAPPRGDRLSAGRQLVDLVAVHVSKRHEAFVESPDGGIVAIRPVVVGDRGVVRSPLDNGTHKVVHLDLREAECVLVPEEPGDLPAPLADDDHNRGWKTAGDNKAGRYASAQYTSPSASNGHTTRWRSG